MTLYCRVLLDDADVSDSLDFTSHSVDVTRADGAGTLDLYLATPASPGQRIQVSATTDWVTFNHRFDGTVQTVDDDGHVYAEEARR